MTTENQTPEQENPLLNTNEKVPHQSDMDTQTASSIPDEKVLSEIDPEKASDKPAQPDYTEYTAEELANEAENLANAHDAGAQHRKFQQISEALGKKIQTEYHQKKAEHEASESTEQFSWEHPLQSKINAASSIFKEKNDAFLKIQEAEQAKNIAEREGIIEKLKNLTSNAAPGTNLFRAIREIKEQWQSAGQVPKTVFKNLNDNYFFHLKQFYEMLDMNKEYLEQEYKQNLEKRQQIILRAKELESEPSVQKALNELQYLHKVWKEEAGPVAEEFRENTWQEFREISNKIHERRDGLSQEMDAARAENLEKKNKIIAEIKKLMENRQATHNFWQQAIKTIENLRENFMNLGGVPKKQSTQNWNEFKTALKEFNSAKNEFYKGLKDNQSENLEKKRALIQTAKDNAGSEDWETAVPLFKKLQEDWKQIGHVPRNVADDIWAEFREACNVFFDNFRTKNKSEGDDWKANFAKKQTLLDQLKAINEEGSTDKIEEIRKSWNDTGKVPKDKIGINAEFNKVLREKLKINHIDLPKSRESRGRSTSVPDHARRVKTQITDLENEIATLENNLQFFKNPSRENPLLADTYNKIDAKKKQLEELKKNLHEIISAE